ncbi:MAG: hypothetical protein HGA61_01855 [Candidatus Moranbacteria bacterium]|nr:hypothetical protein [Candidatus Moranbacteria bacterium]
MLFLVQTTSQNPIKNGSISGKENLSFNTSPIGNFENAKLKLTKEKKSKELENVNVKIRKSYSTLFYPKGSPLGFIDGSLLSVNGDYFIVSNGKARRFVSGSALDQLGFSRSSFLRVSQQDLQLSPKGEDIINANSYPDSTLIVIGNRYYQFKDQQLFPFISERAFLSKYQPIQAIPKNEDFLENKEISENFIGFANGTLASSDQSVFLLTNGLSYPIADSETFLAMGFNWSDVLPLTPAEINSYKRQKQFTVNQPHPDGVLFYDKQANEYFITSNGLRRPIKSQLIAQTYLRNSPVEVDSQSFEKSVSCNLKKTSLTFNVFDCDIDLKNIKDFPGNTYRFDIFFSDDVSLKTANTVFYTKFNLANTLNSLSLIKTRLQNNYAKK